MKNICCLCAVMFFSLSPLTVPAATLYWDADGTAGNNNTATGAGLGGTGNWDQVTPLWFNGAADIAWTNANNDTAVFSGTAGTVTITGATDAGGIYFTNVTGTYVITNATGVETLTLGGGMVDTGGGDDVIGAILIDSQTLTKTGLGILELTSSNSLAAGVYSVNGLVISEATSALGTGTLTATNGGSIGFTTGGTYSNPLVIGDNGTTNSGALLNYSNSPVLSGPVSIVSTNVVINNLSGTFDLEGGLTATMINAGLVVNATGNVRISYTSTGNAISLGTGSITKNGTGDMNIEATTEVFSNIVINGGSYSWGTRDPGFGATPASFQPSNIVLNSGALHCSHTLTFGGNRGIYLGPGGGQLTENTSAAQATIPGVISGPGSIDINKGGSGSSWKFTANNTYTGITIIDSGATLDVGSGSAGTLGTGPTTNNGSLVFGRGSEFTYSGAISGPGSVTVSGGAETILAGASTYTGATTVSGYLLLVSNTPGSGYATGTGPVTIDTGSTLGGFGSLGGPVTIDTGGFLQPGDPSVGNEGVFAISNSLTLQAGCSTTMNIDTTIPTNSAIVGMTSVTYGGQLTVNLNNGTLSAGQTFQLFQAGSYGGTFESGVSLPTLSGNLVWNTNNLAVNGSISVQGMNGTFATPVISGTSVILSGSNGPVSGTYSILATTNLALPVTSWTVISTGNSFSSSGAFNFTNGFSTSTSAMFFLLRQP